MDSPLGVSFDDDPEETQASMYREFKRPPSPLVHLGLRPRKMPLSLLSTCQKSREATREKLVSPRNTAAVIEMKGKGGGEGGWLVAL